MKFKLHDKVQSSSLMKGTIKEGVIIKIVEPLEPTKSSDYVGDYANKIWHQTLTIKWEDGSVSDVYANLVEPLDSNLERKFRLLCEEIHPQIDEKLAQAKKLIDEACALAEAHGVPFLAEVSPIDNSYRPFSIGNLHPGLKIEFICSVGECGDYPGWEYSAICY